MNEGNIVDFWESSDKLRDEVNQAKERFKDKSYYEQWCGIKTFAQFFAALTPAISLVTGILYVSDLLGILVPSFLAISLAFVFIFAWELGKSRLLSLCFTLIYKRSSAFIGLLAVCVLFASVSAFTSIQGANTAFSKFNDKIQLLEENQELQITNLKVHYDSLIAVEDSTKKAYIASVSWKGKININNGTTRQVLSDHASEIKRLRDERKSKVSSHEKRFSEELKEAREAKGYNLAYILAFVAIIELLIIASNWFPIHFDYRVNKQRKIIERNIQGRQVSVTPDTISEFISTHVLPQYAQFIISSNLSLNQSSNQHEGSPVGFPVGDSNSGSNQSNNPPNSPLTVSNSSNDVSELDNRLGIIKETQAYLSKYSKVVDAINRGLDDKQAKEETGVSRTTYYNVKRCMNTLKSNL